MALVLPRSWSDEPRGRSSFAQRRELDEPYSHSAWRLAQLEQTGLSSSHCVWLVANLMGFMPVSRGLVLLNTFTRRRLHSKQPWRDLRCGRLRAIVREPLLGM